jgi:hypothetical protein
MSAMVPLALLASKPLAGVKGTEGGGHAYEAWLLGSRLPVETSAAFTRAERADDLSSVTPG